MEPKLTTLRTTTGLPMSYSNLMQSVRDQYHTVDLQKGGRTGTAIHSETTKENQGLELDIPQYQKDTIVATLLAIFGGKGERGEGAVLWLKENEQELKFMDGFTIVINPSDSSRWGAGRYQMSWEQVKSYVDAVHPIIAWGVQNHPLPPKTVKTKKAEDAPPADDLSLWE